jgi:hypothetical protein
VRIMPSGYVSALKWGLWMCDYAAFKTLLAQSSTHRMTDWGRGCSVSAVRVRLGCWMTDWGKGCSSCACEAGVLADKTHCHHYHLGLMSATMRLSDA